MFDPKKFVGIAMALAFVLPVAASAATISDPLFSNGDTTIDAAGNSTVNGTFTLQVASGEVCEVLRTQAAPQAFTDTSVGGTLGHQFGTYTNVPFNVRVSPNEGTYYPTVQCAGIFGGNRSVDGADNVVVTANLGTIRVVAQGSSSGSSTIIGSTQWMADLIAALKATLTPPTPPASTACSEYATLSAGLYQGSDTRPGGRVGQLQSFLMYKGHNIPLLAANQAPYGFYGNQTASAAASFRAANSCN